MNIFEYGHKEIMDIIAKYEFKGLTRIVYYIIAWPSFICGIIVGRCSK